MLPAGGILPSIWLCRGLDVASAPITRQWARTSPARRLRTNLRPQERHLVDLIAHSAGLAVALEAFQSTGFTGHWRKDKALSDSMEDAYEAIQLPWLFRKAAALLTDLVVEDTDEYFKTTMKAGGVMDIVEQYPWSGRAVVHSRRDKRKGVNEGSVEMTGDGPQLKLQWSGKYSGHAIDKFELVNDSQTLVHTTTMSFDGDDKIRTYKTVYHRKRF